MTDRLNLMVFTDLDGTLLDHKTYEWLAANEALVKLKKLGAGLVLASSKTAPEISALRAELGFEKWPAIVENGAGLLPPNSKEVEADSQYGEIRSVLAGLPPELRGLYCGFGDVKTAEVAKMTGLTQEGADLAGQRAFSEPGLWQGSASQKSEFLAHLRDHGIIAQQGGRFLTLSFGGNKVDQMRTIIETYQPRHTIALGDAPNDVQMLEHADYGVVVANLHGPALATLMGEATGKIIRTKAAGPKGWNDAILDLLNLFELH